PTPTPNLANTTSTSRATPEGSSATARGEAPPQLLLARRQGVGAQAHAPGLAVGASGPQAPSGLLSGPQTPSAPPPPPLPRLRCSGLPGQEMVPTRLGI
ncbi:unnamed protein product, partial [Laminaria digitata]